MYQPESSTSFTDGLGLNHIKAEPEVSSANANECQQLVHFEEKYQIKKEEVESCDEKDDGDFEGGLFNQDCNLENMKFENKLNANDVTNLTNLEEVKDITKEKSLSTLEQKNDKALKRVGDITFVEVKEHLEDVHQQELHHSDPCCKFDIHNDAILPKDISDEDFAKIPDEEIYITIDGCEAKKPKMVSKNKISIAPGKVFKCTLCSYTAKTPSLVKTHFKQVHLEASTFGCPHCDYAAKTMTTLNRHILTKHEDKSEVVRMRSEMVTGKKTSVASRKEFKCTVCTFISKRPSQVKDHFRQVHLEVRNFGCHHCDYAAKTKNSLNRHILSKHEDKSGVVRTWEVCHICEKRFARKYNLKKHIQTLHLITKKNCSECDYQADNDQALGNHVLLVHHPENLLRCYNCGYATLYKSQLKSHMLEKHTSNTNSLFKEHDIKTTGDKPSITRIKIQEGQIFHCPHCDYASNKNGNLKTHILGMHEDLTGEVRGKQACHICEREFVNKFTLKRHINNIHLNINGKCPDMIR